MTEPLFRQLQRHELDAVLDWARQEGWNPGLHDAEAFWLADSQAFLGIDMEGELIGSGAIVSYGGEFGFMGLFMVRPGWRGRGLGRKFWIHRRDLLRSRLRSAAPISMDGVFAMQPFYAKGGFVFTHRNLRMEGVGVKSEGFTAPGLTDLAALPFGEVEAFDRRHFPGVRTEFLKNWIRPKNGRAIGFLEHGRLAGLGVSRPCLRGFKIGPLFAATGEIAETLFQSLSSHAAGQPLFLDVPENNPEALALAGRHGMKEIFGCARMVLGPVPEIPWASIYGVTTFELG